MRPAPPTDSIRAALSGTFMGHAYTNVFWFQVATDGTRTVNDLAALLDALLLHYNTRFAPWLSPGVLFGQVLGVWQTSPSTVLADARSASHNGTGTTNIDDASACAVLSWKIAARYRGGKPRTYLPGPDQVGVTNGSDFTATLSTGLAAAAVGFMADMNAFTATHMTSCQMGTVSWFTAGGSKTIPPTYRTPPVFEPYIGSGVRTKLASQRRRILN